MTESREDVVTSQPRRYRFGFSWLFIVLLVLSVVFAAVARESKRVRHQNRLVNELAQIEVRVRHREPTGLGFIARKLLGQRDKWLTERMDEGWFWRPRVLVTWTTTDGQVPKLALLTRQLGGVRELHLEEPPITSQGIESLRSDLPDVAVLSRSDLACGRASRPNEHFAAAAVQFLAMAAVVAVGVAIVLIWPLMRRRKKQRSVFVPPIRVS